MSNTNTNPTAVRIGAKPANMTGRAIEGGDTWKDTPYFGMGLGEDSAHMKAFPAGSELVGFLRALRTTKAEKEADRKDYACFELVDANGKILAQDARIRISAPGQAYYKLEQAGLDSLVRIVYLGKETVEGFKQQLHQVTVEVLNLVN